MKRFSIVLFLYVLCLMASTGYSGTSGPVVLSNSGYAVTLQGMSPLTFSNNPGVTVSCSPTCYVHVIVGGSTPTGTLKPMTPGGASEQFFVGSDSTGGSLLAAIRVQDGVPMPIDLQYAGSHSVLTVAVLPMTGTVNISVFPVE